MIKVESPDIYLLLRHRWQLFGTLTFRSERKPERLRVTSWFALVRSMAKDFRIYFPDLRWVLRMEMGEMTARKHFHFLLTGLPNDAIQARTCFAMMARWKAMCGFAQVRVFDDQQAGSLEYMEKCLSGAALAGQDKYESAKFGLGACQLFYSHSMWYTRFHTRITVSGPIAPRPKGQPSKDRVVPVRKSTPRGIAAQLSVSELRDLERFWDAARRQTHVHF